MGLLAVVIGAPFALAATATPPVVVRQSTPAPDAGIPPFAVVDDSGAVVVSTLPAGNKRLTGFARDGAGIWSAVAAASVTPMACTRCPVVLALDMSGRLFLLGAGPPHRVVAPGPPDDGVGTPGQGPAGNMSAWATRSDKQTLRLRVVRPGMLDPAVSLGARGVALPLTPFQEGAGFVALTPTGTRAVSISAIDPIRPGVSRLVEAEGDHTVVDRWFPVRLPRPDEPPRASACISADGRRVAVVLPDDAATVLFTGAFGAPELHEARLALRSRGFIGCAFTAGGLVVHDAADDGSTFTEARLVGTAAPTYRQLNDVNAFRITVCVTDGSTVLAARDGATVLPAHRPPVRYAGATDAGCTAAGVPWFLKDGNVTWLPIPA